MATVTWHKATGEDTFNAYAARNLKFNIGTFDYDATAGAAACITVNLPPMGICKGAIIPPSNGYVFKCTVSGTVTAYYVGAVGSVTTAAAFTVVPTGTAMDTCSALIIFAWGYE